MNTAKTISQLMNVNIKILSDEIRTRPKNSEVERLLSNNKKAIKILNWQPKFDGLGGFKRGIKKTIQWFDDENNRNLYKANIFNM